ncbi:PAQR family membrane homeostasis protein TrhA [Knoellia subterranea]|uniref:DNA-binding protein n=1 Tax=Knoellia subterranea KCTC 19937 TaxID=1385521 RepID=A0A0A0JJ19_9MICO|nr:hemolysin III family protein [Knoellia subterranea]KGN37415.1 DNA-binding protein [Knoellia subterranea KCTC 19937]
MSNPREPRTIDALEERVDAVLDAVKPKLRGWLHLAMAPIAFIGGLVLVVLGDTVQARAAAAVFTLTAVLLFAMSAVYHRGDWSPRWGAVLRRIDHSNIFLIIAGSYTPFALLLPRDQGRTLLAIIWTGAILGVLFRLVWIHAPRWLYVPVYVALGSVAVFFLGPLLKHAGTTVVSLVVAGGVLYIAGAVVYGIKRPNPSPRWFGFHEIFHTLTILAFATHYIAASIALYDKV